MKKIIILILFISQNIMAENAKELLYKMIYTAKYNSYQGTLIIKSSSLYSIKLLHKAADHLSKEQERLIAMDDKIRDVIIDTDNMTLFTTENNNLPILCNPFGDTFINIKNNLNNYQISNLTDTRTAGKMTKVLLIKAMDNWRYSYKIWLDTKSNMYTKAIWLDQNKIVYESILLGLKFIDKMPPLYQQLSHNKATKNHQKSFKIQTVKHGKCHAGWLPKGFILLHHRIYNTHQPKEIEHLVFTDGIAKISVYMDKQSNIYISNLPTGRTNIYRKLIKDNYQIVVLGEVPFRTIKKIAESIIVK